MMADVVYWMPLAACGILIWLLHLLEVRLRQVAEARGKLEQVRADAEATIASLSAASDASRAQSERMESDARTMRTALALIQSGDIGEARIILARAAGRAETAAHG